MKALSILLISGVSFAGNYEQSRQIAQEYMREHGYIVLDNEVRITSKHDNYTEQERHFKIHGFVKNQTSRIKDLLDLPATVDKELIQSMFTTDIRYEGLRPTLEDVGVGYATCGINEKVLGATAYGAFRQKKHGFAKDGWTGFTQYFEHDLCVCAYTEHNMRLAHSGVELIEDYVSYAVNSLPTLILNSGNRDGFLYTVTWYSTDFERKLECASRDPILRQEVEEKVIFLANKIERNS